MKLTKSMALAAAAAALAGSLISAPVRAQGEAGFSALQGVEAQPLSGAEMQSIKGMMILDNLIQLTAAIQKDTRLTDKQEAKAIAFWNSLYQLQLNDPRWQPYVDALFEWTRLNVYPDSGICKVNTSYCTSFPGTW